MDIYTAFHTTALVWYQTNGRDLPWRKTTDPYKIIVSEIMLQQTQADRVVPKYEDWLKQFPTVNDLAQAPTARLIRAWAGLGYNRRALYLRQAAGSIAKLGRFPTEVGELQKLPGIGPYTAAAICSFAFNQDVALVDTNIKRIFELLVFGDGGVSEKELRKIAQAFLPKGHSRDWHNALMDIGSIIAKERGAKAQQTALTTLFPTLKQFKLPEVSDLPLVRPKQSNFKTSKRYFRGQIISLLRENERLTIDELSGQLGSVPYPLPQLLVDLAKDGLIRIDNQTIGLPT